MSGETPQAEYFFVDRLRAELVVVPQLVGVTSPSRVVVFDRRVRRYTSAIRIDRAGCVRLRLAEYQPMSAYGIKLQCMDAGSWVDVVGLRPLGHGGDFSVDAVTPADWGIDRRSTMMVRDVYSRTELLRVAVEPEDTLDFAIPRDDTQRLQLDFFVDEGGSGLGRRLLPPIRYTVPWERGNSPHTYQMVCPGLGFSRRSDVTLSPLVLKPSPRGGLSSFGFLGAWEAGTPIPEAMEFTLGRQRYLFHPDVPSPTGARVPQAIYLGPPHASWGHFLTQGLSRVWFALMNPEIPVVWDSKGIPEYQRAVLELLGLRNQQIFLSSPMRFDEVLFPDPGLGLGDYVNKHFAQLIGRVAPSTPVPGKKLFLSRSGLGQSRGGLAGGADRALDELAEHHGFEVYHPEQHPVDVQLREISSAETVLAVEGSALHSLLLLGEPVETTFWALTRHRAGGGVFDHIRQAKSLRYETLNFLTQPLGGARSTIELDIDALNLALRRTEGLASNLDTLAPRIERPFGLQSKFSAHRKNCKIRLSRIEVDLARALLAGRTGEHDRVVEILSWYL